MDDNIKEKVKEYYGGIAKKVNERTESSCCSGSCCCKSISDNDLIYKGTDLKGLPIEAINASLGCANPLVFAEIKEGETVLDLGSGGGIDVLLAAKYVGESGKVYGLDMTDEMLELANKNKMKMGVTNVEFIKGYIEDIPLSDETVDVIMSNCVINLCEDKNKALSEAYRVIKNGGRLAIADIVRLKEVPEALRQQAEMWVGCIAGALTIEEYTQILKESGFNDVNIEIAHVYTKDVIESILSNKKILIDYDDSSNLELLDGAYAGALIKARK